METRTSSSFILLIFLSFILSEHCLSASLSTHEDFSNQKTYYTSPDPHHSSPPHKHTHRKSPSCGTTPAPPHSKGGYTRRPPSSRNGGGGGGYYNSPPSPSYTPTAPPSPIFVDPATPPTPVTTPIISTPPSPILVPITPTTPITPVISTPPSPILDPVTPPTDPSISTPPTIIDPNSPPYYPAPCSYWITHPAAIWSLLGYWGTVGGFFGAGSSLAYGKELTLHQALLNTRTDGIGELYREGSAALLNSMATNKFPFSSEQVKDAFVAALVSQKAAATQAQIFKLANEGKLKKKN